MQFFICKIFVNFFFEVFKKEALIGIEGVFEHVALDKLVIRAPTRSFLIQIKAFLEGIENLLSAGYAQSPRCAFLKPVVLTGHSYSRIKQLFCSFSAAR